MASVAGRQDLESSVCKEPPFTDLTALPWERKDMGTGSAAVFQPHMGPLVRAERRNFLWALGYLASGETEMPSILPALL